ncbi:MAG: histidine phosphatase family protein [Chloroflexota bacterium]
MRYVEHRRHSIRVQPGQHLSQAGVDLARRVGNGMGPFQRVVTSPAPRAFETAIAMGFAVDDLLPDELSMTPDGMGAEIDWAANFAEYQRVAEQGGITSRFAQQLAEYHRALAASVPEGERALIISHGGIVEASAIGCLSGFDYSAWGPSCSYCEGIRLHFDGQRFVHADLLRVPA